MDITYKEQTEKSGIIREAERRVSGGGRTKISRIEMISCTKCPKEIKWNKEKKESIAFITKKVMCTRACVHAQSLSVVSTLCDPKDSTLPGSSIHEIILARILGWVAISSSRGSSLSRD